TPAEGDKRQELVQQGAGQQRRNLAGVVLRLHLDEIEADQLDALQSANQAQGVAAARAADLRRARPGGEARVHEVDVKGEEDRAGPDSPVDVGYDLLDAAIQ